MLTTYSLSDWIDISIPLRPGMPHWPGDYPFEISRDKEMAAGEECNVSRIAMSVHTGTHMDAPLHFLKDGHSMDALPFYAVVGTARIIEIEDTESIMAKNWTGMISRQASGYFSRRSTLRGPGTATNFTKISCLSRKRARITLRPKRCLRLEWIISRSEASGRIRRKRTIPCSGPESGWWKASI